MGLRWVNLKASKKSALFLLVLLLLPSRLHAHSNKNLVESEFPELYHALLDNLGEERTRRICELWTLSEVEFFRDRFSMIFTQIQSSPVSSAVREDVIRKFHSRLIGTIGEAVGMGAWRREFSGEQGIHILNEDDFSSTNRKPSKFRPDGIAYSISGNRLVIHSILESKIGNPLDLKQVKGWLKGWKKHGLNIRGEHFNPEQIDIRSDRATLPLLNISLKDILGSITFVTNRSTAPKKVRIYNLPINRIEAKAVSKSFFSMGVAPDGRILSQAETYIVQHKNETLTLLKNRIDTQGTKFKFPDSRSLNFNERKLRRDILLHFSRVSETYQVLPRKHQRIVRKAGFDPNDVKRSLLRMQGYETVSTDSVLNRVKNIINKKGERFKFPSQSSRKRGEQHFYRTINRLFGGATGLYRALPQRYQSIILRAGFDPLAARGSLSRMSGRTRWNKQLVFEEINNQLSIKGDAFQFPSSESNNKEESSLGIAIKRHWGGLRELYDALSPKHQATLARLGFAPEIPASARLLRSSFGTKRKLMQAIKNQIDRQGQAFKFPSQSSSEAVERSLYGAIRRHFDSNLELYQALPKRYQDIIRKSGFDPTAPRSSMMIMARPQLKSKNTILAEIKLRIKQRGESFKFPRINDLNEEERKLAVSINKHFGKKSALYEALTGEEQRILRKAGFAPYNTRGSVRRMNGTAIWSREAILSEINRRVEVGSKVILPPINANNPKDRALRKAILRYFGNLNEFFTELPKSHQERLRKLGFNENNPIASMRLITGTDSWTKDKVLQKVHEEVAKQGLRFTFPTSHTDDPMERAYAKAIVYHFGSLPNLFRALSRSDKSIILKAGFDPKNPKGSSMTMRRCHKALTALKS